MQLVREQVIPDLRELLHFDWTQSRERRVRPGCSCMRLQSKMCLRMFKKTDAFERRHLPTAPCHWAGVTSQSFKQPSILSLSWHSVRTLCLCFTCSSLSVERKFTGSRANHSVICSSISAATRSELMPCTGGPQDYRLTHRQFPWTLKKRAH